MTWRGWASGLGARRPRGGGTGPGEGNGDRSRSSASPSSAPGATATENNGQAEPRGREPDAKPGLPACGAAAAAPAPAVVRLAQPACAQLAAQVGASEPGGACLPAPPLRPVRLVSPDASLEAPRAPTRLELAGQDSGRSSRQG